MKRRISSQYTTHQVLQRQCIVMTGNIYRCCLKWSMQHVIDSHRRDYVKLHVTHIDRSLHLTDKRYLSKPHSVVFVRHVFFLQKLRVCVIRQSELAVLWWAIWFNRETHYDRNSFTINTSFTFWWCRPNLIVHLWKFIIIICNGRVKNCLWTKFIDKSNH